jgi:hypothetical protein
MILMKCVKSDKTEAEKGYLQNGDKKVKLDTNLPGVNTRLRFLNHHQATMPNQKV